MELVMSLPKEILDSLRRAMTLPVRDQIRIGNLPIVEWYERYQWCEDNIKPGAWSLDGHSEFKFEREADRLLYLLRWP